VLGDWAFARTYLQVTMTPAVGEPVRRRGYVLSIFRKEVDGQWRLARDANLLTKVE
jgi:ketosteroid isomerase-like protein